MKLYIVLCIFAVIGYISAASLPQAVYEGPTYELKRVEERDANPDDIMPEVDLDDDLPSRPRRITCDVLSWTSKWFSFNNSACAVRCLAQRRRGGSCQNGVCICR